MTNTSDLKTGDLVLCKVGSFPPWPAVIFPQKYLRKDVYNKRKSARVAVCFFNDPTYYWEQPQKLKRLTSDLINSYLTENSENSSSPNLVAAYEEAKNFTNLNDFIVAKFSEEGRSDELEAEETIPQGEDPFLSKVHQRSRKHNNKNEDSVDTSSDYSITSNSTNGSSKLKRKLKSYDSDETDITSKKSENSLNSKESINGKHLVKKKKPKLDSSRNIEICMLFRRKIQKNLIQRETVPSTEEIDETHNLLNKIEENLYNNPNFFEINALRQSKLHKLLRVIINDSNLSEFHDISRKILLAWTNTIHQLKLEKIAQLKETKDK